MAPSDERDLIGALDLRHGARCALGDALSAGQLSAGTAGRGRALGDHQVGRQIAGAEDGREATIIAYGALAWQSLEAAKLLENEGAFGRRSIDARFCKPLDGEMLQRVFMAAAAAGSPIFTVEDHSIVNGFGTAVVEHAAEKRYDTRPRDAAGPARSVHQACQTGRAIEGGWAGRGGDGAVSAGGD